MPRCLDTRVNLLLWGTGFRNAMLSRSSRWRFSFFGGDFCSAGRETHGGQRPPARECFECSSPPLCVCVCISETWFSPAPEGRCAVNSPSTLLVSAGCSSHERRSVGFNSQHSSRSHADSPFYILVGVHYANSLAESNWTVAFSRCFFFVFEKLFRVAFRY